MIESYRSKNVVTGVICALGIGALQGCAAQARHHYSGSESLKIVMKSSAGRYHFESLPADAKIDYSDCNITNADSLNGLEIIREGLHNHKDVLTKQDLTDVSSDCEKVNIRLPEQIDILLATPFPDLSYKLGSYDLNTKSFGSYLIKHTPENGGPHRSQIPSDEISFMLADVPHT